LIFFLFFFEFVIFLEALIGFIDENHFPNDLLQLLFFSGCNLLAFWWLVVSKFDDV